MSQKKKKQTKVKPIKLIVKSLVNLVFLSMIVFSNQPG